MSVSEMPTLRTSEGSLSQGTQKKTAEVVGSSYQQLRADIRQAPTMHTDDTGWRIGGTTAHLMVFTSPQITVFQVRPQHRNEEVREVLGDDYPGVLHCDRGKSYDAEELRAVAQQKCLSHLTENAREVEQRQQGRAREFPRRVRKLLQQGLALARCRHQLPLPGSNSKRPAWSKPLTHHLRDRLLRNDDNRRLVNGAGFQHDRGNLLCFLRDPRLEPTNNLAERALRPAVIRRKVSPLLQDRARGASF